MFNLDQAVTEWRRQMLGAGVKAPVPLDELESHLREAVEEQARLGASPEQAFDSAVRRLGHAELLQREFAKVGGLKETLEHVKRGFFIFAGIPNHYLADSMNTSSPNIEPRWATYLKAAAFLLPAVCLWGMSTLFLFPKLQQICEYAGVAIPFLLRVAPPITHHSLLIAISVGSVLALLEWRFHKWPQYRRAVVGAGVFVLNSTILILIFATAVVALLAAPALVRGGH